MDDERRNPIDFGSWGKGQGQHWHSVYKTLWARYRLQFLPNHFQTSHVRCGWWEVEFYWFWVTGSKVKVNIGNLCKRPCGHDTDLIFAQSLSNFWCKLWGMGMRCNSTSPITRYQSFLWGFREIFYLVLPRLLMLLKWYYTLQDGGNHLVVVDESNDHVMSVWDIQDVPQKVTEAKVRRRPIPRL